MTDPSLKTCFFLGANSSKGFLSLYEQWIDQTQVRAFYILKGGAGCGKSTLMKAVAESAEELGEAVEYISCSGDPDSLDGVYLPGKRTAMADGTAPHRLDPVYPGATGHYVNLGEGYNRRLLAEYREEVIAETRAYRSSYDKAYRKLRAAADALQKGRAPMMTQESAAAGEEQAKSLFARECKISLQKKGRRIRRFLGGPTCQGDLFLDGTVRHLCKRGYQFRDELCLAYTVLEPLEKEFLSHGYDVISCPNPYFPEQLAHVLIPELSLAFVSGEMPESEYAVIGTEDLAAPAVLRENRFFFQEAFLKASELNQEGIRFLVQAKKYHDRLEQIYRPFVDFSFAERWTAEIREELELAK